MKLAFIARWTVLLLAVGVFRTSTAAGQDTYEVGPELTQIYLPSGTVGSVAYEPAFGGTLSVNIKSHFGIDSSISFTPKAAISATSYAGGTLLQGFAGARVGGSKGRVSLYAKARPGFASFSGAILTVGAPPASQVQLGRLTEPSVDFGGIIVVRVSRRFAVRYEMGDTLIFYSRRAPVQSTVSVPGATTNNLQFATGFLFRF
jgi:hypothetical protein